MRMKRFVTSTGVTALALAMWITPARMQGQPMYDRITVNLPYPVSVGDRTLAPGDYVIQQLPDTGGASRVLLFYSDKGMKFETSAMSIPALDPNTARDTKLVLDRVGDDFYINKIWVQGKDYGYEFPMPGNLKSRQKEIQQTSISGHNQPSSTAAEYTTPPPAPQPAETAPVRTGIAQSTPPTSPPAQPAQPAQPDNNGANREMNDPDKAQADRTAANDTTPKSMPSTSAGWLTMLLSGSALSGAGLMLRRKR